ncbi:ATP-grasp domain-containing protein [Elusimicrobiota bacterium]
MNLIRYIENKVKILGTSPEAIDLAEDRVRFSSLLKEMKIPHPEWGEAKSYDEALLIVKKIGYPVMLRPSYVLGGRAMEIAFTDEEVKKYIIRATEVTPEHPVLIDKFLEEALEVDVDCICDGEDVFIAPLMEHIEKAGIHSGDSACVTPPISLSEEIKKRIKDCVSQLALKIGVKGLMNVQCALKDDIVYILEVNPRASRTVPFISKVIDIPMAKIATKIMLGRKLKEFDLDYSQDDYCVKEVVLPFLRFSGVDPVLGPEMKSTGEVMGRADNFPHAFYKAQVASGNTIAREGKILVSLNDESKERSVSLMKRYVEDYEIYATPGTADFLHEKGVAAEKVQKIGKGKCDVEYIIKNKDISLIINTPSGKKAYSDGYWIRRWAYENQIPLITTIAAAEALIKESH